MKWFPHDTDATQDAKIRKLLIKHGAVGYAIYFHCLELIAAEISESNLTFELEHDSEIIADNLHIKGTADKSGIDIVQEIMRTILSLNLFEQSEGRIFCFKLLKRVNTSMTSNERFREMITMAKAKYHDAVMISHDPVMTQSCKTRLDYKDNQEEKENTSFPFLPDPSNQPKTNAGKDLELIREHWNSIPALPKFRHLIISMPPDQTGPALRTLGAYSLDDVIKAVDNYVTILQSVDHEAFPRFTGFPGFMRSGPDNYGDDAKPFERCKIVKPEQAEDRTEREVREAKEQLARIRAKNKEASR